MIQKDFAIFEKIPIFYVLRILSNDFLLVINARTKGMANSAKSLFDGARARSRN